MPKERPTAWLAPPEGLAKVNVDGAVSIEGSFGAVAAVCRDQRGKFLGASAVTFRHIIDPNTLEALGVREGQSLADDLYENRIHIASDSKLVVNDIKVNSAAGYGDILHEINYQSRNFFCCNIVHEFRSSNFEAHNLARHARSLGFGRHVWLGQPTNLNFIPVNVVSV